MRNTKPSSYRAIAVEESVKCTVVTDQTGRFIVVHCPVKRCLISEVGYFSHMIVFLEGRMNSDDLWKETSVYELFLTELDNNIYF